MESTFNLQNSKKIQIRHIQKYCFHIYFQPICQSTLKKKKKKKKKKKNSGQKLTDQDSSREPLNRQSCILIILVYSERRGNHC